jgi:hypothetical protein
MSLSRAIISNTRRYVELFSEVLDELLKGAAPRDNAIRSEEIADVLTAHRLQRIAAAADSGETNSEAIDASLPARLVRRWAFFTLCCLRALVRIKHTVRAVQV